MGRSKVLGFGFGFGVGAVVGNWVTGVGQVYDRDYGLYR